MKLEERPSFVSKFCLRQYITNILRLFLLLSQLSIFLLYSILKHGLFINRRSKTGFGYKCRHMVACYALVQACTPSPQSGVPNSVSMWTAQNWADLPLRLFWGRETATMRVLLPLLLLPMASVSASCFGRDAHFKKAKPPVVVQTNRADPTKVWWFSTICFLVTSFPFSDPGFLGASNWKTTMCWQVNWLNATHITTGSGASNH